MCTEVTYLIPYLEAVAVACVVAKSAQREREASFLKQKTGMNYKPELSLFFKTLFHKYSEPQELLGSEWKLTLFPSRVGILQL